MPKVSIQERTEQSYEYCDFLVQVLAEQGISCTSARDKAPEAGDILAVDDRAEVGGTPKADEIPEAGDTPKAGIMPKAGISSEAGIIPKAGDIPESLRVGLMVNVLNALQKRYRYVPVEALYQLSVITSWPFSELYSLVSAFSNLTFEPVGRNLICVCDGTACHTRGSLDLVKSLEDSLELTCGSTSEDGEYTLKSVYCVGTCSLAPVLQINDQTYGPIKLSEASAAVSAALSETCASDDEDD